METIAEQIEALAKLNAELVAKVESLTADKTAAETLLAESDAALTAKVGELATVQAELESARIAREKAEFDRDAAKAEQAKAEASLESARKAVASNPAFADAATSGTKPLDEPEGKPADLWAQYNSLTDPVSRGRFWQQHGEQLKLIAKKPK